MSRTINWTPDKLKALIEARNKALDRREDRFTVKLSDQDKPAEFLVNYAKHLIGYLEGEFARNKPPVYPENREGEEGQ